MAEMSGKQGITEKEYAEVGAARGQTATDQSVDLVSCARGDILRTFQIRQSHIPVRSCGRAETSNKDRFDVCTHSRPSLSGMGQ